MKKYLLPLSLLLSISSFAQQVDNLIKEDDVSRIIKTLSADDMMGRPAKEPALIEKATAFIENEFKSIGLKTLKGLKGYRQEFQKEYVSPLEVEVVVDGNLMADENIVLSSDEKEINIDNGLSLQNISYTADIKNLTQHFFDEAFKIYNDSTSSLIFVSPEFKASFSEFKGYVGKHYLKDKKRPIKVFILGNAAGSSYAVRATQKFEVIKMANVVGVVEGKSKRDEMVVFSAHYDHLGIQKLKINGDSIANGADDDASGTTAVITLAQYFKKIKDNDRTLIFVAFTAEEVGGFGSQYFSKQLNPDKVVAMFNIEMIGKPSKWGQNFAFISGYERSDFGKILENNLSGSEFHFNPDPYPEQNLFYRSDNATLARLGVPAHTISTDQIDSDKLYHTVKDEFESMDVKNITNTIKAIAISSKSIVEGMDTPTRIDKTTVH